MNQFTTNSMHGSSDNFQVVLFMYSLELPVVKKISVDGTSEKLEGVHMKFLNMFTIPMGVSYTKNCKYFICKPKIYIGN